MSDICNICGKPLAEHQDQLMCCPAGCHHCRCLCGPDPYSLRVHCSDCDWSTEMGTEEQARAAWHNRAPTARETALADQLRYAKDTLATWREWARAHGHLDHAAGIVMHTDTILKEQQQ